ncbi:MAG: hypothetical protein GC186_20120 [Rhodobacteraceae bacterium]|nr:hypothetical protein [Paracoccaceae bacterium]
MRRKATNPRAATWGHSQSEREIDVVVNRINCACAARARYADAPLARAMFRRVETDGQSVEDAARALGIGYGDGAYLLAGLRRDVAAELATVLLSGRTFDEEAAPPEEQS